MSMSSARSDELREAARNIIQGNLGRCLYRRKDVDEMQQVSGMLFEAADAIESLRDRLQPVPAELDYIEDKSRWFELFGTPERAARTIAGISCDDGGCEGCTLYGAECSYDESAMLDWLRNEGEMIDEPDTIRNELADGGLIADVLAPVCVDEKEWRAFERGRVHERFAQQIFKEAGLRGDAE